MNRTAQKEPPAGKDGYGDALVSHHYWKEDIVISSPCRYWHGIQFGVDLPETQDAAECDLTVDRNPDAAAAATALIVIPSLTPLVFAEVPHVILCNAGFGGEHEVDHCAKAQDLWTAYPLNSDHLNPHIGQMPLPVAKYSSPHFGHVTFGCGPHNVQVESLSRSFPQYMHLPVIMFFPKPYFEVEITFIFPRRSLYSHYRNASPLIITYFQQTSC